MKLFQSKTNITYIFLFIFAFLYIFVTSTSSPLYKYNEWVDCNVYFTTGKGLFNGKISYKDLFDHKGPLLYVIFGIGYLISNADFLGVYIIESIFLFTSIFFAYKLVLLFLDKIYALFSAVLFPVFLLRAIKFGGSAEEFVSTFFIISLYLYCLYFTSRHSNHKPLYMFFHGLSFMSVLLIKMNLAVFFSNSLPIHFYPIAIKERI